MTPELVVYHKKSFSLAGFMKNRFLHGRQFGSSRAATISSTKRMIYVLLSPLIPALFLLRISRQVIAKKRHLGKLLVSSPVLLLFLFSWALGEFTGYLGLAEKENS
jgi:hypothetical protein